MTRTHWRVMIPTQATIATIPTTLTNAKLASLISHLGFTSSFLHNHLRPRLAAGFFRMYFRMLRRFIAASRPYNYNYATPSVSGLTGGANTEEVMNPVDQKRQTKCVPKMRMRLKLRRPCKPYEDE